MVHFLVDNDELELTPNGFNWVGGCEGKIALESKRKPLAKISGKAVVLEEDIRNAAQKLIGEAYNTSTFPNTGAVRTAEIKIDSGQQRLHSIGGMFPATNEISGTFSIKVVPATNSNGADTTSRDGTWKVSFRDQVLCHVEKSTIASEPPIVTQTVIKALDELGNPRSGCTALVLDGANNELQSCTLDENGVGYVLPHIENAAKTVLIVDGSTGFAPEVSHRPVRNPFLGQIVGDIGCWSKGEFDWYSPEQVSQLGTFGWKPFEFENGGRHKGGSPCAHFDHFLASFERLAPEPVVARRFRTSEVESDLRAAWDWFFGVLAGDFNTDPSMSQIVARAVLTMIPYVDQVADVQDIIAALYKIIWKKDSSGWFDLFLTAIGCIPTFGSAFKGIAKLLIKNKSLKAIIDFLESIGGGNAFEFFVDFMAILKRRKDELVDGVVRLLRKTLSDLKWIAQLAAKKVQSYVNAITDLLRDNARRIRAECDAFIRRLGDKWKKASSDLSDVNHKVKSGSVNHIQTTSAHSVSKKASSRSKNAHKTTKSVKDSSVKSLRDAFRRSFKTRLMKALVEDEDHPLAVFAVDGFHRMLKQIDQGHIKPPDPRIAAIEKAFGKNWRQDSELFSFLKKRSGELFPGSRTADISKRHYDGFESLGVVLHAGHVTDDAYLKQFATGSTQLAMESSVINGALSEAAKRKDFFVERTSTMFRGGLHVDAETLWWLNKNGFVDSGARVVRSNGYGLPAPSGRVADMVDLPSYGTGFNHKRLKSQEANRFVEQYGEKLSVVLSKADNTTIGLADSDWRLHARRALEHKLIQQSYRTAVSP